MKKKDLYKIVKQSLKEVIQEQKRLPSEDDLVDFNTGLVKTSTDTNIDMLAPDDGLALEPADDFASTIPTILGGIGTFTTPDGTENFNLNFWAVTVNSNIGTPGTCDYIQVDDSWLCNNPGTGQAASGGVFNISVNGGGGPTISTGQCAEHGYAGAPVSNFNNPTHAEFLAWLSDLG